SGGFLHPPLIISPHQSDFNGQPDPHLNSLLSLNFEVGSYRPLKRDKILSITISYEFATLLTYSKVNYTV
ncbi:hypothetical protein, partial [Bacillus thuringiensis]|uniref:hypothetical protein n=1 Tax=Bacillus thuringiensis TaxID=1428 RepID=UPI001EE14838